MKALFNYISLDGSVQEGELRMTDYQDAERRGMRASEFVNARYPDANPAFGTAFKQGQQNLGIFTKADRQRGIRPTKVADILDGTCMAQMAGENLARGGIIVAPSQQGTTPATRLFYPETVMEMMVETLTSDFSPEMQIFERMISSTDTIDTEQFTQPMINVDAPRASDGRAIAQNTMPRKMVSITSSQTSKSILTESLGLEITKQAQRNASLDLVSTILAQQAEGSAYRTLWRDLATVVSGSVDAGTGPLTAVPMTDFDAAATAGEITQLGWLKSLYRPDRILNFDSIICTIDDFFEIQNRTGRPLVYDPSTTGPNMGALGTYGLNVEPNLLNWSVGVPNVMLVPDGLWAAQNILMFDSRYALRKVVNASASYAATEEMVLQRSDVFRFDWGSLTYRLRDEAFQLLDYS